MGYLGRRLEFDVESGWNPTAPNDSETTSPPQKTSKENYLLITAAIFDFGRGTLEGCGKVDFFARRINMTVINATPETVATSGLKRPRWKLVGIDWASLKQQRCASPGTALYRVSCHTIKSGEVGPVIFDGLPMWLLMVSK